MKKVFPFIASLECAVQIVHCFRASWRGKNITHFSYFTSHVASKAIIKSFGDGKQYVMKYLNTIQF